MSQFVDDMHQISSLPGLTITAQLVIFKACALMYSLHTTEGLSSLTLWTLIGLSLVPQCVELIFPGSAGWPIRKVWNHFRIAKVYQSYIIDRFEDTRLFGLAAYFLRENLFFSKLVRTHIDRVRLIQTMKRHSVGFVSKVLDLCLITLMASSFAGWKTFALMPALSIGTIEYYRKTVPLIGDTLGALLKNFDEMGNSTTCLDLFHAIMDLPIQKGMGRAAPNTPPRRSLQATVLDAYPGWKVEFINVSYKYPSQPTATLDAISFTIQPGEVVSMTGQNGAGKTTLTKLLTRLTEPTSGRILINGRDARDFPPHAIHQRMGVLLQDFTKFDVTAYDNISYGWIRDRQNPQRVQWAARASNFSEVAREKLGGSLSALLGTMFRQSKNLSGGEWQRLAIARTYMRIPHARCLVLDEPTSALAAEEELATFARLLKNARGKTIFYITHRLSCARASDKVLVLEHGRLIEQGTHDALVALGGRYAEMYRVQASGYQ